MKQEMMGWQWHQLDQMQTCASHSRQITTPAPHYSIFTGQMLFQEPIIEHRIDKPEAHLKEWQCPSLVSHTKMTMTSSWCPTNSITALKAKVAPK